MKMSAALYANLVRYVAESKRVAPDATPDYYATEGIGKDTAKRHRWDAMRRGAIALGENDAAWLSREVYPAGLNDNHIDTALRRAVAEVFA
jgi:hypothetical protein